MWSITANNDACDAIICLERVMYVNYTVTHYTRGIFTGGCSNNYIQMMIA